MNWVLLGFASNAEPERHFSAAYHELGSFLTAIESSPVIFGPNRDGTSTYFYNALISAKTNLSYESLKEACQKIETRYLREKNAQIVTLDLDLLGFESQGEMMLNHDLQHQDVAYLLHFLHQVPDALRSFKKEKIGCQHVAWHFDQVTS